uniref:Uncharacterized protein n=1 Tax=Schistocephalus solidus TaxID=70667 RepID=A0A0X3PE81_SCHSO
MANHRLTVGNRVLPVANSCCLCCCKCFAATMTTIGLIALAAGIAFFIIFRNSDDDFEIFEYEDVKQKVPIYAIATVLVIVGSVFFVVSLCMWCCVCCMTPKSQPGVVLVQPTSIQTFATVQQPAPNMAYSPAVMAPPSAPPPQMPTFQPPPGTATPPPYTEKDM